MIHILNSILWAIATVLILFSGFYFTFNLKFVQFRFKEMFNNLFNYQGKKKGITPIQSFMMTLASRIGVGSIAGVAFSIYIGGVGSIFWMWITAFLLASNTFAETVLGIVYRTRESDGIYRGGPSYYMRKGLNMPVLGGIYAIIILFSYVGGFVSIQSNTITKSLSVISDIKPIYIGFIISIITAFVIYGGVKSIVKVTEKIVPIMSIFYIGIAFFVMVNNIKLIPGIFLLIIKGAFNFKSATAGVITPFIIGIQRGIFSNEAGLGTGSITSSTSSTDSSPTQGYIQIIGIYVTTLLICTSTVIIVLTSPYQSLNYSDLNGIEIAQFAFNYHLGSIGGIMIFIAILFFSFVTILTGYYDGESSLKYFFNNKKIKPIYIYMLKIVSILVLFAGCITPSTIIWEFVDMLVALLAITNIYALLSLRKVVKYELDYYNLKKSGKM
ncbi:MAG TPA: alanine:cation symporter family protein [Tenericutes bacterium]|nr:alanine:cation symporter family protein [Mycoplasmatota bacterium]